MISAYWLVLRHVHACRYLPAGSAQARGRPFSSTAPPFLSTLALRTFQARSSLLGEGKTLLPDTYADP